MCQQHNLARLGEGEAGKSRQPARVGVLRGRRGEPASAAGNGIGLQSDGDSRGSRGVAEAILHLYGYGWGHRRSSSGVGWLLNESQLVRRTG